MAGGIISEMEQLPSYAYGEMGAVRINDWRVLQMKVRMTWVTLGCVPLPRPHFSRAQNTREMGHPRAWVWLQILRPRFSPDTSGERWIPAKGRYW